MTAGNAFDGSVGNVVRDGTSILKDDDPIVIATCLLDEDEKQP